MLAAILLASAMPARAGAQDDPGAAVAIERLAGIGKVWGFAKYFHPALAYRDDLDWDAALIDALPRVRAARNPAEYAAAVQGLLAVLEDPLTRVEPATAATPAPGSPAPTFGLRMEAGRVLVVTTGSYYALYAPEVQDSLRALPGAVAGAAAVVIDARSADPTDLFGRMQLADVVGGIERRLVTDTLRVAAERRRVYHGFEAPSAFSSGQYRTGYFIRQAAVIVPAANAKRLPIVYVTNRHAGLPPSATALQRAGRALIVYEGSLGEHSTGESTTIELAEGLSARVRVSDMVFPDGADGDFHPDAVVPAPATGQPDAALARARSLAAGFEPSRVVRGVRPAASRARSERAYPSMRFPDANYRALAAFRIWSAIEYFHPYRELLEQPWSDALARALPAFEGAQSARDYGLAVAALAVKIRDSHSYVAGPAFTDDVVGAGYPPIQVRVIEGVPVVTALFDRAAARRGARVGDVVLTVDGRPAAEKLAETARLLSTSTPQSRRQRAAELFMNGPVASPLELGLQGAGGKARTVRLQRKHEDYTTLYHRERTGEIVRILPGNIGYVDLDRLTLDMVDPMFETLRGTRAIIFDMRGYPHGTVWAIAPRLADSARVVARFRTPLAGYGPEDLGESFVQTVSPPEDGKSRYRGRTVMLIDERTVSQAEHTGLYLKAANGTRFVGSPSAGADGEITSLALPGELRVAFTGQAVTFPDGTQLQQRGLAPDLPVTPTIAGIRAGIDEVLDAAVRLVAE